MAGLGPVESAIWVIQLATQIVLLLRLWALGVIRRYRFFSIYLAAQVSVTSVLLWVEIGTSAYGYTYALFVPVRGILAVLVVLELYSVILRDHTGIATLGRWVVSGGLAVAFTIAAISLFPDLSNPTEIELLVLYVNAFERALDSALLLFLMLITAFLIWFPVPLSRNSILHTIIFGVYFSSQALLLLIRNLVGYELTRVLSTISLATASLCLLDGFSF